jgi:hypothetical protein
VTRAQSARRRRATFSECWLRTREQGPSVCPCRAPVCIGCWLLIGEPRFRQRAEVKYRLIRFLPLVYQSTDGHDVLYLLVGTDRIAFCQGPIGPFARCPIAPLAVASAVEPPLIRQRQSVSSSSMRSGHPTENQRNRSTCKLSSCQSSGRSPVHNLRPGECVKPTFALSSLPLSALRSRSGANCRRS